MDGFLLIPMGQKGQKGQNRVGRIILVDPVLFLQYFKLDFFVFWLPLAVVQLRFTLRCFFLFTKDYGKNSANHTDNRTDSDNDERER